MPEESAHDNTEEQPESESNSNRKKGIRPIWLTDTVAGLICFGVFTILTILGASLLNGRPKPLLTGWTLICLGIWCFGGTIYFGLKVHRKKQLKNKMPIWLPKWAFIGITIVGFLISAFAVLQERPDSKSPAPLPHLSLAIMSKPNIWLTNQSFLVEGAYQSTNFLKTVVVPVKPQQTNARLTLAIANDEDGTEARSTTIIFVANKLLSITPDRFANLNWQEANWDDDKLDGEWQSRALILPGPMQAHAIFELPSFTFQNIEDRLDRPQFMRVVVRSTGIPQSELAFWVVFWRSTNMTFPKLASPKSVEPSSNGLYGTFEFDDK